MSKKEWVKNSGKTGLSFAAGLFLFALFAGGLVAESLEDARIGPLNAEAVKPAELVRKALTDSLYYKFDKWFAVYKSEIERLERSPRTLDNRIELMKYHFYFSGLLGELCHTLAFTSKYKIKEIEDQFIYYSNRAKELAVEILASPGLTTRQKAQSYLYLGGAEGYIGIFEYGAGNLLTALINGYQADNHLEQALLLDPNQIDAHFGLGIYRYGNSRLGGIGNFIMQGGKDLRLVGLDHIEHAILEGAPSKPLALKTLAWFYISEQINPANAEIPQGQPLSVTASRSKVVSLLEMLESQYFKNPPYPDFIGNKELAMMQALQFILDSDYAAARKKFAKVLEISEDLKNNRGFAINPQLIDSVKAGIEFCSLMLLQPSKADPDATRSACLKVNEQLNFLSSGGALVEYDSKKIRSELHSVFYGKLQGLSRQMDC